MLAILDTIIKFTTTATTNAYAKFWRANKGNYAFLKVAYCTQFSLGSPHFPKNLPKNECSI